MNGSHPLLIESIDLERFLVDSLPDGRDHSQATPLPISDDNPGISLFTIGDIASLTIQPAHHTAAEVHVTSGGLMDKVRLKDHYMLTDHERTYSSVQFLTPKMRLGVTYKGNGAYEIECAFLGNEKYLQAMSTWGPKYPVAKQNGYADEFCALKQFYAHFVEHFYQDARMTHEQVDLVLDFLSPVAKVKIRTDKQRTSIVVIDNQWMLANINPRYCNAINVGPYHVQIHHDEENNPEVGVILLTRDQLAK